MLSSGAGLVRGGETLPASYLVRVRVRVRVRGSSLERAHMDP